MPSGWDMGVFSFPTVGRDEIQIQLRTSYCDILDIAFLNTLPRELREARRHEAAVQDVDCFELKALGLMHA